MLIIPYIIVHSTVSQHRSFMLCDTTQITSNYYQNIEVPKQQVTHNTACILQYLNAHTPIPFMYFY